MMRRQVVLDTNCLLQIVSQRSENYFIWEIFLQGGYDLCVTNEIMEEYEEILCQKANRQIATMILEIIRLAPNTQKLDASYHWHLISADPDDNKFVDCAVVANADFIVSEDKHFRVLKSVPYPRVNVIRLEEFKRLYSSPTYEG